MTKTIELGRDFNGELSSQPVTKSGKNKGFRRPEKGGNWIYAGGFNEHSRLTEKAVHSTWIQAIQKLGHKVGRWDFDGVTSFYIFQATKEKGLKELTRMTEEFGGYKKEQEMLKPCPECGAETQGTWIRINQEDIWHVGCTKCNWQPR